MSRSHRSLMSAALTMATAALPMLPTSAHASSHREAPYVTEHPKVDGTDFYMFRSYEPGREDYVTIIANYLPLQDAYGGPNYFFMDPDARYAIHLDNNGDGREDLTYRFQFNNQLRDIALKVGDEMVSIPLINIGPITASDNANLNITESYRLEVVEGDRDSGRVTPIIGPMGGAFMKPMDNIGMASIPDYPAYAAAYMYDISVPGSTKQGRVFVGQRKDPFVVNLGEIFDLVNTNPLGPVDGEEDKLADANVTSFILELPIEALASEGESVIGGWTTASLRRSEAQRSKPTFDDPSIINGRFFQVSRLGSPLVNEVVIGLKDKDLFNASEPKDDGQFLTYVTNPTLPAILNILFSVKAPCLPRNDLVSAFLTGVAGLNQPANVTPSEMLRLNTSIPVTPAGLQSNLGVLGGDLAGFPNGRRPGDDVVDIELRVAMGALLDGTCAPDGQLAYTDGAYVDATYFDDVFPYLKTPLAGSPNE